MESGEGRPNDNNQELYSDKRPRTLTAKALDNAIDQKRKELSVAQYQIKVAIQSADGPPRGVTEDEVLKNLELALRVFKSALQELQALYNQNSKEYREEALLTSEYQLINYVETIMERIKNEQTDKLSERLSRRSKSLSAVSTSSSARLRAQAAGEAAAARKSAEYERIKAEKEHARKQREVDQQGLRDRERAQHDRDMAILEACRKEEIANAKLQAIEETFSEADLSDRTRHLPKVPLANNRTSEWVHESQHAFKTAPREGEPRRDPLPCPNGTSPPIRIGSTARDLYHPPERVFGQQFFASTPMRDISGNQLIETLTATNQQIVSGLARQNLPKCHPDTFDGDATLFHPWKKAFKTMIKDAEVLPEQEVNYLRKFTSGEVQRVVDNFRKRQQGDPAGLLQSLWLELERRFGSSAVITNTFLERLHESAAFCADDTVKLQEFADVCADIDSQVTYLPGLACLNFPNAIRPIVEKLPALLRSKWDKEIVRHAEITNDAYPDFHKFTRIIQSQARMKNHPNIIAGSKTTNQRRDKPDHRRTLATITTQHAELKAETLSIKGRKYCPFHELEGHDLIGCKGFNSKSLQDRTAWIQRAGLCFLCLSSTHRATDCTSKVSCDICGDTRHIALLHMYKVRPTQQPQGEANEAEVNSKCTAVCKETTGGASCSKIILVDVFVKAKPDTSKRAYAIIDDQSNTSLISSDLADALGADGPTEKYYLSTCSSDNQVKYGRRVPGLIVRAIQNGNESELPTLVECDSIPEDKTEIPTPEVAKRFPHLRDIADEIPPVDSNASVHILLGRDAPELLKVRAFRNGPRGAPWAQKLFLGWTVSGKACLDLVKGPVHIQTRRTKIRGDIDKLTSTIQMDKSRESSLDGEEYNIVPCPNKLTIMDDLTQSYTESLKCDVFHTQSRDNEASLSCDDRKFLEIMEKGIHKNDRGNWEMPLPFRQPDVKMPNNRSQAECRFRSLLKTLKRKPQMEQDYIEFMEKVIEKGHASPVPADDIAGKPDGRVWYLPHFGVYHPKKPTQIRVVFDSSAEFKGVSLNKELLPGPDLMNSLLGVLIRFRRERVGVICDVEQMFHSFHVDPNYRDFLRFLWFEGSSPQNQIIEYRMNVHLFGNGPNPAVATFGLRKTADYGEEAAEEVTTFVNRNFYVDDGLASLSTPKEAIDLIRKAQTVLGTSNLRLHKVASNSVEVVEAFPTTDRAKDLRDLDLQHDSLPAQRSLGVFWNLETDTFTFRVQLPTKPFTRRGVLAVVNSIYDPLGLAAPVVLDGKKLLQQLVVMGKRTKDQIPLGWDDPLPKRLLNRWQGWKDDLQDLEGVSVRRCYHPEGFGVTRRAELHTFSDASQDAIAAAVYLRLINQNGNVSVTLVYGRAKVAPVHPTSIPRLELCGAVLATQATSKVLKEIDMEISEVLYYTDSKVVLGYITNESRRFYVYVANRVQAIRSLSSPEQWRYVESGKNPADLATRGVRAGNLSDSTWLNGPDLLSDPSENPPLEKIHVSESDPEVRKEFFAHKTKLKEARTECLGAERFTRFSSFSSLQRALANLIVKVREFKTQREKRHSGKTTPKETGPRLPTPEELRLATKLIIQETQRDALGEEIESLSKMSESRQQEGSKSQPRSESNLHRLDAFLDEHGVLRVGGRLRRMSVDFGERHPVLLPKDHHVSTLVVRHHHKLTHHQGRQITHGALRQAGYWLIGGHRLIAKVLNACVVCRKLRGVGLVQRMADLPADRVEVGPPFTNVGFDVFGPWMVSTRRTRGGAANSKRWGLVFTCLSSRAIHIEVLEMMDSSAFICALRRFFALRGPAVLLRCDRGTNFVGGKNELEDSMKAMDPNKIEKFVTEQGCEWKFNPPHASHFGGVWERQIGTIRRVLNAMFAELGGAQLTHEILVTLMAEVSAIVNARPIASIPTDTDDPQPLSPSMILTMKMRPLGPPPGEFLPADLYVRRRWRRVQYLADQFWTRWRREYLQSLQTRSKWNHKKRNLAVGDVVLVREEGQYRNDWPLGRVAEAHESDDGVVRKVTITVLKDGKTKTALRSIKELVLLVPTNSE